MWNQYENMCQKCENNVQSLVNQCESNVNSHRITECKNNMTQCESLSENYAPIMWNWCENNKNNAQIMWNNLKLMLNLILTEILNFHPCILTRIVDGIVKEDEFWIKISRHFEKCFI